MKVTYPPATTAATRLFETLAYDGDGNVTSRTDTANRTTSYAYDNVNRVTTTTDADNKPTNFAAARATKLTREEQLIAFQGIVDGDYGPFREMVMKAPDGEADAVATLLPEDVPLVRRARRASISRCSQHAVSDYGSFTKIPWALVWKQEKQAANAR